MNKKVNWRKLAMFGCVLIFSALATGAYCDNDDDGYYYVSVYKSGPYLDQMDCDDHNPLVHPNATELCDGLDNDCDGVLLDGETVDQDGDGLLACEDEDDAGIDALVDIKPEAIKMREGVFTAMVVLPEGYDVADIVECYADGAPAIAINVAANKALCKFDLGDVTELPLDTYFEVWGVLADGTSFWGADEVSKVVE